MADALSPTMRLRDFENGIVDYASWVKARAKRKGRSR
jgi:hypothetical protein